MNASPGHVLVVGAGVFGCAAALELRARGWRVTLLDPGPLPHPDASSTDVSKVVRMDYGSDVFYHELAEAALGVWDRWNAEGLRPLYHQDGFLLLSHRPLEEGGFEADNLRTLQARGYAPERVGGAELERRYPAWRGDDFPDGYLSPRAGWAESGEVVARLIEACGRARVSFRRGTMRELLHDDSRASGVAMDDGVPIPADEVLVCAGAWTPAVLPWLAGVMEPRGQPVLHFGVDNPSAWSGERFPPWAADIAGSGWYGFPALADGRVKVGHHGVGLPVAPDARGTVSLEHETRARAFLRRAIPGLADAPVAARRVCMYCDTFDGDFFIGRDPARSGLTVASGGSGHGFKFAPVIGPVIADALEGRSNRWLSRFGWRERGPVRVEAARYTGV